MWKFRIEQALLLKFCPRVDHTPGQAAVTVKVAHIRDGTPGVSLIIGDTVIGEWPDSRADSLALSSDSSIEVYDINGNPLYRLILPGTLLSEKQVSDSDVTLRMEL